MAPPHRGEKEQYVLFVSCAGKPVREELPDSCLRASGRLGLCRLLPRHPKTIRRGRREGSSQEDSVNFVSFCVLYPGENS